MKKLLVILAMLLFSLNSGAKALDTLSIKYMPMHLGDFWVYSGYKTQIPGGISYFTEKLSVVYTRAINNHIYYYLKSNNNFSELSIINCYLRVDSLTGSLMCYDSTDRCPTKYHYESLRDSLASVNGDTTINCNRVPNAFYYRCLGTTRYFIFGDSTTNINFRRVIAFFNFKWTSTYEISYSRNYGFSRYYNYSSGSSYGMTLKGCRINGIIYGDTISTSINIISTETPSKYSLSQNYPNPFNPTTNIKFSIVKAGDVKLVVYDIQGREVQTLVNESLKPGTYEAAFNIESATEHRRTFGTGVYFYKLITNGFTETKKMLLIK